MENHLDYTRGHDFLQKFVRQLVFAPEVDRLSVQRLLCLRVEGGIHDQTIDEQPQIGLDLVRLNLDLLVFLLDLDHEPLNNLVGDVFDVSATLGRADRVDKGNLLERSIAQTANDLPSVGLNFNDLGQLLVLLVRKVVIGILLKILGGNRASIELDLDFGISDSSQVVNSLGHERHNVLVQMGHVEFLQIRLEAHLGEVNV